MNSMIVVFAAVLAVAYGGVIAHSGLVAQTFVAPAVKSTVVQGPSSSAHVVGSDGSQIVAHAPGASIHATEHVGVASEIISGVAYSAPVAAPIVAHAAPVVAHAAPIVAHAAPVVAHHAAPVVAHHAAPVVAHHSAPVVAHHAAPVIAHHVAPVVAHAAPVVAHAAPIVAHHSATVVAHASPVVAHAAPVLAHHAAPVDYSAPVVAHAHAPVVAKTLVASPVLPNGYPALAAGSGLEGQYIHDINEQLHDDGLYKGEIY